MVVLQCMYNAAMMQPELQSMKAPANYACPITELILEVFL